MGMDKRKSKEKAENEPVWGGVGSPFKDPVEDKEKALYTKLDCL